VTRVQTWLEADEANARYFHQLKTVWDKSLELAAVSTVDENKAWNQFKERVQNGKQTPATVTRLYKRFYFRAISAAAILIIAFGLIWLNQPAAEKTLASGQSVLKEKLADGSEITLNKQSTLEYPTTFKGKTRSVKLKGEAFFQISPDKAKPFIIDIKDVQVTVVGTSFNIREDSNYVEVLVETGVVKVSRDGQELTLNAGEKIQMPFTGKIEEKEKVTDKLHNYYRTKEFVCDDTPLWKLVQVLNEAYKTKIVFGKEELKELRMNTSFYNESLDQVLEVIRLTFSINIRKQGDTIILE
jgi:ferric-dicitrate binding protein FerR (iron transport regulator)